MRRLFFYLLLLSFAVVLSCDHFKMVKKESREELLKQEWNKIEKSDIEEPPLFKTCEQTLEELQNKCFANTLHAHLSEFLNKNTIFTKKNSNDTIWISILIDRNAKITIENLEIPENVLPKVSDFRDLITKSIDELPPLKPATKRGIPTNIRYKLPLVLKAN